MHHRTTVLLLAAATVLAGCTLVDQRTFNPDAGRPPAIATPPGPPPVVPLVTIDFDKAAVEYRQPLTQAVQQALARKQSAEFDVVTVVPATGTPDQQVAAATAITPDARSVARAINASGVDDSHIHLSARAEPGVSSRQVQVFVH